MSFCFALDKLDSLALTLYVNFWYIIIIIIIIMIFIIFKMLCLAIIQKCGISVNSHIVALGDDVPRISAVWFRACHGTGAQMAMSEKTGRTPGLFLSNSKLRITFLPCDRLGGSPISRLAAATPCQLTQTGSSPL